MVYNQLISDNDNRVIVVNNPTAINLVIAGKKYPAFLNDTVTAKALLEELPYTVTVSQGMHDYCGGNRMIT